MPTWKPGQSGNPSGRPRRKAASALFDTDGLAVLDNCQDVIDSILKLMRDEKNIEDAQKENNELFPDVCESRDPEDRRQHAEVHTLFGADCEANE